jgi:hypothetical protein
VPRIDAGLLDCRYCVCAKLMPYRPFYLRRMGKLAAKAQRLRGLETRRIAYTSEFSPGAGTGDQIPAYLQSERGTFHHFPSYIL